MALPLAVVYRALAQLHDAGVGWPEALDAATAGDAARFAPARGALSRGVGFADALEPHLPPLDVAGLRAGEASGRLSEALKKLAERHEAERRRSLERRGSLAYPLLVAHVAALLLPIPDLVAGRIGAAIGWAALVLVPLHAVLWLSRASRRAAERDPAGRGGILALWRTPAAVEEADARALTALAWLFDAGVPLLGALPLAARAGAGGRVAADCVAAVGEVAAGRPIAPAFRRSPAEVSLPIATGEASGTLSDACRRAADSLAERAAYRRKRFAAMLPVAVTVVLGAVVGVRVLSFYAGVLRVAGR
jgi:type II secretory pathway component PulF